MQKSPFLPALEEVDWNKEIAAVHQQVLHL